MTTSITAASHNGSQTLYDLIERITEDLQAGRPIDAETLRQAHPEYADRLADLLPALELLADLSRSFSGTGVSPVSDQHHRRDAGATETAEPLSGTLGDFRILREAGRGGMGIVYESEQISLRRRVALKVLPFAGMLDPRQLQRFQNEARAAAGLHHPNIVPVYSVGSERGVHYYAMQYIDGCTLADALHGLRRAAGLSTAVRSVDVPELDPTFVPDSGTPEAHPNIAGETASIVGLHTQNSRSRDYVRRIAEIGIQVADALDYAHSVGVVHRDIKPSNLLLDARGTVWVADFGLAQIESDAGLTMTGDVLGTLRYMSPKQALGQRAMVDQRSDVYSLGVTLYELLTLQPAFLGTDRQQLPRQVGEDDPKPPRQLNPAVPHDLETIVLKAIAKEPEFRYRAARNLAEDPRRWRGDQPIAARRPSLWERGVKWSRRHRGLVAALIVILLITTASLTVSTILITQAYHGQTNALGRERDQKVFAVTARQLADKRLAELEQERQHAENNLQAAMDAVDQLLTRIGTEELDAVPRAVPVRSPCGPRAVPVRSPCGPRPPQSPRGCPDLLPAVCAGVRQFPRGPSSQCADAISNCETLHSIGRS